MIFLEFYYTNCITLYEFIYKHIKLIFSQYMEIKGNVYCFFEQSSTFRDCFRELGYNANDYDICNYFQETDYVIDLFEEIDKAYFNKKSIFDGITEDDLILAFFPCTYFCSANAFFFQFNQGGIDKSKDLDSIQYTMQRVYRRAEYHSKLLQLYYLAIKRKLRLIIENPAKEPNYLITGQNFIKPTFIEKSRRMRGDYFIKPTAYWFINCEPTVQYSLYNNKIQCKIYRGGNKISTQKNKFYRSIISKEYAYRFICDNILGINLESEQPKLF